jgi:hypothetical protein
MQDSKPVTPSEAQATSPNVVEDPIETESTTVKTSRTSGQWSVASAVGSIGITIGVTGFSVPAQAVALVGIGALLAGAASGVLLFSRMTVTRNVLQQTIVMRPAPDPSLRPFPEGSTTHFAKERQLLSRDNSDFIAAFAPGMRAGAYDQMMHELEELILARQREARRLVGANDDTHVAEAVEGLYEAWLSRLDEHYRQRQIEDDQERTGRPVNQVKSAAIENEIATLLATARMKIAARDQELAYGQ